MRKKSIVAAILVLFTTITIVVTSILQQPGSGKEYIIRIGYLPLTANLPLFVALERNLFEEEGLNVETKKFESSNQMVEALVTGRIDVETAASSSVTVTVGQKLANKIDVFMLNAFTPEDFLSSILVKENSSIVSAQGLNGKKIGTFPGSTMRMYTEMVLTSLEVKAGEVIQLPPPTQLGALDTGSVDALMTLEPLGTLAEVKKIGRKLVTAPVETHVLNPWVAGTNSFSSDFVGNYPKLAERLRKIFYRAVDYIRLNPADAKKTMIGFTPVTDEGLASRLTIPNYWKTDEMQVSDFQDMADNLLHHGEIDNNVDVADLIMQR
uniref:NitT/TauT family transport system substrate-binding protein n=1 Tax=Candidatus Kentrum eta TaxID=2126337 RepID=A0A450V8K9_9GAMM|nr:MAG: NitT/TauT family transport system substrate-binding protein [Candidatus Kentron sp. H]VFK01574.1 MAG: NitT/TauT family transport system substrate-binding protein [Candidatus Kentron sp. H]VFK04948.1 MAG: NitT/TauT family transport system substrate-binding protein [Candidatus Kentron sp. H]